MTDDPADRLVEDLDSLPLIDLPPALSEELAAGKRAPAESARRPSSAARDRALKLAELRSRDLLEEIDLDVVEEVRTRGLDDETRAVGNQFKQYWVYGEGRRKWTRWRQLVRHLVKHVGLARAKRIAAQWFHERYGFWPGDDRNRVRHGKPPRGKRIGPG